MRGRWETIRRWLTSVPMSEAIAEVSGQVEPPSGPMHKWFELSYASYLVIPRILLTGLPQRLQRSMVAILDEIRGIYDFGQVNERYSVMVRDEHGKFTVDPLRDYMHSQDLPYTRMCLFKCSKCTGYAVIEQNRMRVGDSVHCQQGHVWMPDYG